MGNELYVGNLSYSADEEDLRTAFGAFGSVESVSIVTDRETGRSRGFGFVKMSTDEEAKSAITGLGGKELKERALVVNEARPREQRDGGQRGGGGGFRRNDRY
ncbi:MAG: RNA recognition motif domain-containing protein [Vulcanimicrobiota bacterium]